jgi:3-isopropylmalate/(R)-2-methylmalate dehydratase small subunit
LHRFTVEIPSAGITEKFDMDTETQQRFINGLDDISITLADADAISKFEASRPAWLAAR